ncbi:LPXTG cell wall anchor domain-containing protein [Streptomyces sp. WAC07061]|uniref:LPXTG cell wall anchor domain-containing protein n=1 Tax=Streptomyces sp. WAC07061 TaxID=2487410 RepID=UPI000F79B7A3|nr:LPXTG cell wall anchor domain-containing protein [Streptomyces sp. WAC07061]RSS54766.1 LPXTG cell wall anchor domain-containing protein [Streptomyces sp. WAC07061]
MSARRPLLTALGATTLLAALWFVPSANATAPGLSAGTSGAPAAANTGTVSDTTADDADDGDGDGGDTSDTGTGTIAGATDERPAGITVLSLADTGSIDTTPYVLGGTLCLGLGAGFVAFSVRRSRSL